MDLKSEKLQLFHSFLMPLGYLPPFAPGTGERNGKSVVGYYAGGRIQGFRYG